MHVLRSSIMVVITTAATLGVAAADSQTRGTLKGGGARWVPVARPCYTCAPVQATEPHRNAGPPHGFRPTGPHRSGYSASPCYTCAPVRATGAHR